jgi:hypothetical protein
MKVKGKGKYIKGKASSNNFHQISYQEKHLVLLVIIQVELHLKNCKLKGCKFNMTKYNDISYEGHVKK